MTLLVQQPARLHVAEPVASTATTGTTQAKGTCECPAQLCEGHLGGIVALKSRYI